MRRCNDPCDFAHAVPPKSRGLAVCSGVAACIFSPVSALFFCVCQVFLRHLYSGCACHQQTLHYDRGENAGTTARMPHTNNLSVMELKYDLYAINNFRGTGEERKYVRLMMRDPMTARELESAIEQRCSLTKGDVAAVLSELRTLCVQAFKEGRRFYLPQIGYLSLAAALDTGQSKANHNIIGHDVRLTGIKFRPEASLMKEVSEDAHFVRTKFSNQSEQYEERQMLAEITAYVEENRFITSKIMRTRFGLSRHFAFKWLAHFCEKGVLVKAGQPRAPIYFLKNA